MILRLQVHLVTWLAAFFLAVPGLVAQETIATPAPTATATATPKEHSLSLSIDTDDDSVSKDLREKLTADQLFQLQLERAKHPSSIIDDMSAWLVPLGFFATIALVVFFTIRSRSRQRELTHQTLRMMVEKGQPVPPELFMDPKSIPRPRSDLRRGLILVSAGVGLVLFFLAQHDSHWGVGLIPLFIGIGYLAVWKIQGSDRPQ